MSIVTENRLAELERLVNGLHNDREGGFHALRRRVEALETNVVNLANATAALSRATKELAVRVEHSSRSRVPGGVRKPMSQETREKLLVSLAKAREVAKANRAARLNAEA